jgi:hypothetical protein
VSCAMIKLVHVIQVQFEDYSEVEYSGLNNFGGGDSERVHFGE